jgi:hypothetical protein
MSKIDNKEQLADVLIYEIKTRKVAAIIGKNLPRWSGEGAGRNTAELRLQTGKQRINDNYDCMIVKAGTFQEGDVLAD